MLTLLHRSLEYADRIIAGIPDNRRDAPTPSEDFTVEQLTLHLLSGLHWAGALPGGGPGGPDADNEPDPGATSLVAAYRAAAGRMRSAWTPDQLDRVYDTAGDKATGAGIVQFMIVEVLGHGWDLAVATGQPADAGADIATAALRVAEDLGDVLQAPGMMAPPVLVPEGASPMDRFVAFLGRDPARG
jgi:uncharacterized protein (TIGR03086 family)